MMKSVPSISLKNVSVDFEIHDTNSKSFRHAFFLNRMKSVTKRVSKGNVGGLLNENVDGRKYVRALSNISLNFEAGDRVGLIGHNGSGKTTLLRVLSGIFEPTEGEMTINGIAMPLFNITEGMEPEATGSEFIKIRGHLLGLTKTQISSITEDVSEFCELGEFINLPIKTYSAGMLVRLAFGVTTAITSDILLMDEIIGAGDAAFLEKADQRLKNFINRAGILVVASHSPSIISQWCNKAILLENGSIVTSGNVDEVSSIYENKI